MATKDEIKSLLEAEIGPLKAKLTSIEKSFFELEKSVKHFSAKYDELLKQVQRSNDRTASLSTDVKNLKEDMKQCKKIGREIEDLSQYLRRDCLELTGVLPTEEVSCFDLVCSIGKEMGIELQDEDISTAHRLPTYNKSAEDKIIVKFTRRSIRDESFRIFADDANIFVSSSNAVELQNLINHELSKVKEWCYLNKLPINLRKLIIW